MMESSSERGGKGYEDSVGHVCVPSRCLNPQTLHQLAPDSRLNRFLTCDTIIVSRISGYITRRTKS